MTIEEAITTSIQYETRVEGVYRDAAGRSADPAGGRVFGILADEERHHVEYLKKKLEEWKSSATLSTEGLDSALPPGDAIRERVRVLEARMTGVDHGTELEMLQKALDVEMETSAFYKRVVETLPAEGRPLFARFLEIEEGHLAVVQAEIDALNGLGYWFDIREFDLEGA